MLSKKVVKKKKLQRSGDSSTMLLIPKMWVNDMNWNQETRFIMEYLPHRKQIVITEYEEISKPQPIEHPDSEGPGEDELGPQG